MPDKIIVPIEFETKKSAEKAAKQAEKQFTDIKMNVDVDANTSQATKKVKKLESELKGIDSPKITPEVDTAPAESALSGLQDKITDFAALGAAGIAAAVGAAMAELVARGGELEAEFRKLSARTGRVGEDLDVLREKADSLFLAGVGEDVTEAGNAFAMADQQLKQFLKSDEEIEKFTKSAAGIANTFDLEINEVLSKSRTFIANFGLDAAEAGDLISLVMRDAANQSEDVLDTLSEYSVKMKEAGINSEQFTGLLIKGVQAGAWNTDKLADSIQETSLRLEGFLTSASLTGLVDQIGGAGGEIAAELATVAKEAEAGEIDTLELLGISGKRIKEAVDSGEITETIGRSLIGAVSGVPSEAIGSEIYGKMFSAPIDENEIKKQAKQAGQLMADSLEPKGIASVMRIVDVAINDLATTLSRALAPVFELLAPIVAAVYANMKVLFTIIEWVLKPIGWLVDGFKLIYEELKVFEPILKSVGEVFDHTAVVVDGVLIEALDAARLIFNSLSEAIFGSDEETKELGETMEGSASWVESFAAGLKNVTKWVGNFASGVRDSIEWVKELFGVAEKEKKEFNKVPTGNADWFKMEKASRQGTSLGSIDDLDGTNKKLKTTTKRLGSAGRAAKKAAKEFKQLGDIQLSEGTAKPTGAIGQVLQPLVNETSLATLDKRLEHYAQMDIHPVISPMLDIKKIERDTKSLASSFTDNLAGFQESLTGLFVDEGKERRKANQDELESNEKDLKKSLGLQEISYEEYQSQLSEVRKAAAEEEKAIAKETGGDLSKLQKGIAAGFGYMNTVMAEQMQESLQGTGGLVDVFQNYLDGTEYGVTKWSYDIGDVFNSLGESAGEIFAVMGAEVGAAIANGENGFKALGKAAANMASQLLMSIAPLVIESAFSSLPFPLALAAVGIGLPLVFGLLESFKGAEEGVIGIDSNYNTKPGKTDKIPFLLAQGEGVLSKSAVDSSGQIVSNKELFQYANKTNQPMENLVLQRLQTSPQNNVSAQHGQNNALQLEIARLSKVNAEMAGVLKDGINVNSHSHLKITKPNSIKVKKQVALYR